METIKDFIRPESGPMQFENDWPGIFIRGDNAGYIIFQLRLLKQDIQKAEAKGAEFDFFAKNTIDEVIEYFNSAIVGSPKYAEENVQLLKSYKDCKIEKENPT